MNVLAVFHKQIGDTLLLEPALARLSAHAGTAVDLTCPPSFEPLVELMGNSCRFRRTWGRTYDLLVAYDPGSTTSLRSLGNRCADKHLVLLSNDYLRRSHRWIYQTHHAEAGCGCYVSRHYWLHTPVPTQEDFRPPRLNPAPGSWALPGLEERPFVLLNPVSAWRRKSYDAALWVKVLKKLIEAGQGPFVLCGTAIPWHQEICRTIAADFSPEIVLNYCGRTSLRQFLWLTYSCRYLISVDGSASHLAQAFGRPSLTLFGPSKPLLWHHDDARHPYLDARNYTGEKNPPVSLIPPDDVAQSVLQLPGN